MKAFVAVAATIAAAEASHYGAGYATGYGYAGYAGPQGLGAAPLGLRVHPNGAVTPNDEPAVAAAKADHFAAKGAVLPAVGYAHGPAAIAAPAIAAPAYAGHAIAAPAIAAPAIAGGYGYAAGYGHAIAPIGAGLPTPLDVAGQVYPAAEPYLHDLSGEAYPEAEPYIHDATGEGSPAAEEYVHDASGEAAPAAEPYIHDATGEVYPAAEPYVHIEPIAAIPAIAHPAPIAAPAIGYAGNYGYAAAAPAIAHGYAAAPAIAHGYAAAPAVAVAQHTVATPVTRVAHQTALVGVQRHVAAGPVVAGHGIAAGAAYAHQW